MHGDIEFDARVDKQGTIHVPDALRHDIDDEGLFHVTLSKVGHHPQRDQKDAIDELMENPLVIPNFRMPSRDEMHERH
jgi:hypothetical protein